MKRSHVLLSVLAALLVIALFYILLFQPARDELAQLEEQIAAELVEQQGLETEISRLQAVREEAPEVEANLSAAEAIVPRDASLPSALRQLQMAADESQLVLRSVTTSRPVALPDAPEGLSAVTVAVEVDGRYFQVVDFLRRLEDPAISPRGLGWQSASVIVNEYPMLTVALSGELYAMIAVPPPPASEEVEPELETDGSPDAVDADAGVELEEAS